MTEKYYSKRQCIANFLQVDIRKIKVEEIGYTQNKIGECIVFYKNTYIGIYDKQNGKMKKYAALERGEKEKMLL